MTRIDTQSLLALRTHILENNRALAEAAQLEPRPADTSFNGIFAQTLARTSVEQAKSSALAAAYERGETKDIAAVMLQRQKAAIAFETTLQVRNKLVSAYKDIMNMPL